MKKILIILIFIAGVAAVTKAETHPYLVMVMNDSTKITYLLDGESSPVMKFGNGSLQVNVDNFVFADVAYFNIQHLDEAAGIGEITKKMKDGNYDTYKIDGRRVVDTRSLPVGVYVIKKDGKTFKVLKR